MVFPRITKEATFPHGDDAEMVGLPLDDFVYDVYALRRDGGRRAAARVHFQDHVTARPLPDDPSRDGLRVVGL